MVPKFAQRSTGVHHPTQRRWHTARAVCRISTAAVVLLLILGNIGSPARPWTLPVFASDPLANLPRVFLWAWERPENLEFLDPREAGVAVLAKTLVLNGESIVVHPRLQPIELPRGISTIAVVRIESSSVSPTERVRIHAVREILDLTSRSAAGIQIDFDARASERSFYRTMLTEIRRQMPTEKKLSITALASWCI